MKRFDALLVADTAIFVNDIREIGAIGPCAVGSGLLSPVGIVDGEAVTLQRKRLTGKDGRIGANGHDQAGILLLTGTCAEDETADATGLVATGESQRMITVLQTDPRHGHLSGIGVTAPDVFVVRSHVFGVRFLDVAERICHALSECHGQIQNVLFALLCGISDFKEGILQLVDAYLASIVDLGGIFQCAVDLTDGQRQCNGIGVSILGKEIVIVNGQCVALMADGGRRLRVRIDAKLIVFAHLTEIQMEPPKIGIRFEERGITFRREGQRVALELNL